MRRNTVATVDVLRKEDVVEQKPSLKVALLQLLLIDLQRGIDLQSERTQASGTSTLASLSAPCEFWYVHFHIQSVVQSAG